MALARPPALITIALVALATVAALTPAAGRARGSEACKQWGSVRPKEISNGQARAAVLCLVNRERARAGVRPLRRHRDLQRAAQRHTDRMLAAGCFSHQCGGEPDLGARLENAGYLDGNLRRWVYGENLAWGMGSRGTPAAVVAAWMDSPPHRATMLTPGFREIGVGFGLGTPTGGGAPGGTYTIDLGLAVD